MSDAYRLALRAGGTDWLAAGPLIAGLVSLNSWMFVNVIHSTKN